MDDEDDWPKTRHTAADVPPDDGRLGRATAFVYALAGIAVVVAIVVAALWNVKPPEPDCGDSRIVDTLLSLARERNPMPDRVFDYAIDHARRTGTAADGSRSCAADLVSVYKGGTPYAISPITYTLTKNAEGKTEVTVIGLPPARR